MTIRSCLCLRTASYDWYGLHFVQTLERALTYFQHIRGWLDAHSSEVVVIWVSRHGSTCDTVFDNVTPAIIQAFWDEIEDVFDGLMFDVAESSANTTTLTQLVQRDHRVIFYTSPGNFSSGSRHAMNGCTINNVCLEDVTDLVHMLPQLTATMQGAAGVRALGKAHNSLFLLSMSGSNPPQQVLDAALATFFGTNVSASCVRAMNLAPESTFCPMYLMDAGLLANYYNQLALEAAVTIPGWDLPMAIYIDAVDREGTIRTGPAKFGPHFEPGDPGASGFGSQGYAFVATCILANIRRACLDQNSTVCWRLTQDAQAARDRHPFFMWNDTASGRVSNWPRFL